MDGSRSTYPCKAFPYKRVPFGFHYPCRNKGRDAVVRAVVKEPEPVLVEESDTVLTTSGTRRYPPLKRQCSYPYFRSCKRSCRHRRLNFTPKWQMQILNEWEREKEKLVCISPSMKDSYDILCGIPICEPKPLVTIKPRKPFSVVHCVFCDGSLYSGGTIYDLHDMVPAIKRQSNDQDDDIAYRIGLRTRVTVHKSCFDEYSKRKVTYLLDYNPDKCNNEGSSAEIDEPRV